MKYLKNNIKKISIYIISILFLEILFKIIVKNEISVSNIFYILLHSIILSSFLCIISNIFKEKINRIITSIILFIIGVLFSIQTIFYKVFKVYFSLSNLKLKDQLNDFKEELVKIIVNNIFYIILFLIPFILYLIFKKKINTKQNNLASYLMYFLIILILIPCLYLNILSTKNKTNDLYELYFNINETSLNINKLGVMNSYEIDLYRTIFGFQEKIDFVEIKESNEKKKEKKEEKIIEYEPNTLNLTFKETSNNDILTINNYIKNEKGTLKNEYTGKFKGYNLVYITAESFSQIGINKELTPTLYKLTHTGFIFDNYYTPNALSTIGGEFQSLLGLYPDNDILNIWRSGNNYFPFGLANVFKNLGYNTYAYHNNLYNFQDRHKYLKSQGFDNYLGCYNGLEKRINCKTWPESDIEMIEKTIPDYINNDTPFLAYYMTVSGHFEYSFNDNYIAYKNRNYVKDLNLNESAKSYVATQIELDRSLEKLISELETANKLDNTVIVLLADHYPYELNLNSINSLSSYERDEIVEVNHNSLILWNNKMDTINIDKPCMSSDVLPTVYNLFGIDYDSRLFTGQDILSDSLGIAIMRNRSFVTSKGTYFSNNNYFTGSEDAEYIKNINQLVNNRLTISKLILKTNYYNYLFN